MTADSFITNNKMNSLIYNTSAAFVLSTKSNQKVLIQAFISLHKTKQSTGMSGLKIYRRLSFFGRFFLFHIQSRCREKQRNLKHKTKLKHKKYVSPTFCSHRSLLNNRNRLSANIVASSTQTGISRRGCLQICPIALKVLTSLKTCSIFTLLFSNARLNFRARLLSLWLSKCICPARTAVNKEPPSGYPLSARNFAFGGVSRLRPGPIGSISLKEMASCVLPKKPA